MSSTASKRHLGRIVARKSRSWQRAMVGFTILSCAPFAVAGPTEPYETATSVSRAERTLAPSENHGGFAPHERPWEAWQLPAEVNWQEIPASWQQLLSAVVAEQLPAEYEDTKRWGMQQERWDGVDIRREGWQIRTHRKRKRVNHGTWQRYKITPVDPAHHLQIRLSPIQTQPDGRAAVTVELAAKIHAVARLSQWNQGVRLASVTIEAEGHVRVVADCLLDVALDPRHLPPDLILRPEVTKAHIECSRLHLARISHWDGPLVRELSHGLEKLLNERLAEKQPDLTAKLNRQIERHADDLRLSLHDAWQSRWRPDAAAE